MLDGEVKQLDRPTLGAIRFHTVYYRWQGIHTLIGGLGFLGLSLNCPIWIVNTLVQNILGFYTMCGGGQY